MRKTFSGANTPRIDISALKLESACGGSRYFTKEDGAMYFQNKGEIMQCAHCGATICYRICFAVSSNPFFGPHIVEVNEFSFVGQIPYCKNCEQRPPSYIEIILPRGKNILN